MITFPTRRSQNLCHKRQGPVVSFANSSVSFTYSQFFSIRNSGCTAFSHYNSIIQPCMNDQI
ncbi:hypothetical protein F2Q70_00008770 [Brassica cretica]|uniref:Uncharacterized protein n=1 Tax=Brassica cretica TaxID=69181 RepID=A0A8S9MD91_BRACR|nr:hypothetical protein F2Q70_00008770 [Brassica cretica]